MKYRANGSCGVIFAMICAALLLPLCAGAEQIDASQFRRSFTISFPGYAGTTTLTDFPVLVRLSLELNDFQYDKCADGGDLRFSDADGNMLAHEIDTWVTNGVSLVWVKVSSLNSSTVIKAYYGYKGAGGPPAVNPKDVWSNGYLGVWHLGESARPLRDSTTSGLNFTAATGWANRNKSSKLGEYDACNTYGESGGAVGRAVSIDRSVNSGKGGIIAPDDTGIIGGLDAVSVEIWAKCAGDSFPSSSQHLVSKRRASGATPKFRPVQAYYNANKKLVVDVYLDDSAAEGNDGVYTDGAKVSPNSAVFDDSLAGKWNFHVFQYDKTMNYHTNYLNGVYSARVSSTNGYSMIPGFIGDEYYALCLGNDAQPSSQSAFNGSLDELRISNVARSGDWVKASYDTVHSDGFASFDMGGDWTNYEKRFTVSFPDYEGATLTDFPVLLKLAEGSPTGFSYADCLKENGEDLRFSDLDGNLLASEVDNWDTNGVSTVWVKVPSLSASTAITAYYGYALAPSVAASDVWANGYLGVWHLNESGFTMACSTRDGADFTCESGLADYVGRGVGGLVGNAAEFDLVTDGENAHFGYLYLNNSSRKFCGRTTMTIEYWVYQRESANGRRLMYCKTDDDRAYDIYCQRSKGGYDKYTFTFGTTNLATSATADPSVTIEGNDADFQTWKHHSVVFDSEMAKNFAIYIDGNYKGGSAVGENSVMLPTARDLRLGNLKGGQAFPSKFDEVRISGVARSEAWLKATYDTIRDDSFAKYGRVKSNRHWALEIRIR